MAAMIREFHYQVPWRAHGAHPGHHAGVSAGDGFEFQGHASWLSQPDPRHLDVRATLANPFGHLMVKSFRQSSAIPVYLLADLSASMGFVGTRSKTDLLAELAAAIAFSAYRTGDPFGFFGCGETLLPELTLPLRWHKGLAGDLRARLSQLRPSGRHFFGGLAACAAEMGRRKALVFLLSDFHAATGPIEHTLQALLHHDVVPLVLWDSAEYARLPAWGWTEWADPETGQRRRLFMRPSLQARIRAAYAERRAELRHLFVSHGREPFFIEDRFDADALTRYFFQA